MRHTANKKGVHSSQSLQGLPPGSPLLVYLSRSKTWDGPFKFIHIDGEIVVVQTGDGRKIFRSSFVKPMVRSEIDKADDINIPCDGKLSIDPKKTDEDIADEKGRALVSNTSYIDELRPAVE